MKPLQKNQSLNELIQELKKLAIEQDNKLWKRIASELEKPTRQRRIVNVYKIAQHTKEDDTIIVPGKVLGVGDLNHKVRVAALQFSEEAREKIAAKGTTMSINELMQQNPKGSHVKILG